VFSTGEPTAIFLASPSIVTFSDYFPGCVYEVRKVIAASILLYYYYVVSIITVCFLVHLRKATGIRGRSPLLLMSLVDGHCVLPEPIGWLYLKLDCPPSVAELFRLPPLKSGTLYRNRSSQPPSCSPSCVTWKRFYYNNLSAYSTL